MITIKFNGKPTQIPTSTPITTFLTTHNYNPIHVVVELNEVIIPKDSYPTTTLSPDDTLEILTFMGGVNNPYVINQPHPTTLTNK